MEDVFRFTILSVIFNVPKLFLISGEEEFLVERAINEEVSNGLFSDRFEYEFPAGLNSYLEESSVDPIDGFSRAFIIRDAKDIPQLPSGKNDILIFVGGSKKLSDPRAKITLHFPKLKSFNDNNEILGWILKEGEHHTIDLKRISVALFVNSGKSLRKLSSEIQKIAALVPPGTIVSPEEALSVMCFSAELTPKEIIDAICISNPAKALAYYEKLQEHRDETGWILAYMIRHVANQLRSDLMLDSNIPEEKASSLLKIHPFVYKKTFAAQRGKWSKGILQECLGALCDLDISHKRGLDVGCSLQILIKKLCEEAGDVRN